MGDARPGLLKRLWREAPILTAAFAAALVLTLFFAGRLLLGTLYWTDPSHRDVPPAPWMTPRYVAHSWDLPPELVAETLALPRDGSGRRATLQQLARERGVPVEVLIEDLKSAIAAHRADPR